MIKIKHTTIKPKEDKELKDYIETRPIKVKKMTLGEWNGDNHSKAEGYFIGYPDEYGNFNTCSCRNGGCHSFIWCEKDVFDKKVLEGIYKSVK